MVSLAGENWMQREKRKEAKDFRTKLKRLLCKHVSFGELEKFMADPDHHPRYAWLDFLLSCPSKHKSGFDRNMRDFGALTLSRLITYFPDIILRELFLDSLDWIDPKKPVGDRFGALHAAVICSRAEIVQLLSNERTQAKLVREGIRSSLDKYRVCDSGRGDSEDQLTPDADNQEYHVGCSEGYFDSIKRAVLWSKLPNPREYTRVVKFLKRFEQIRAEDGKLRTFLKSINSSTRDAVILLWIVILAWALASEQNHVLNEFKECQEQLRTLRDSMNSNTSTAIICLWTMILEWASASEQSQIIDMFKAYQKPLSKSVSSKRTGTGAGSGVALKQLRVDKIMRIVNAVIDGEIDDEGATISQSTRCRLLQVVSLHNLSIRINFFDYKYRDSCRWTAIHLAAALGDSEVLCSLLESYKLVLEILSDDKIGYTGDTGRDQTEAVDSFLRKSLRDGLHMTPLHHAALENHHRVVQTLLKWDFLSVHVNDLDILQRTAFQIACSNRTRVLTVKEMLSSQAINVNTKDCCGFSPLHWAVYAEATEVVRVLVFDAKSKAIRYTVKSAEGLHPHRLANEIRDQETKKDIQDLLLCIPEVKDGVERLYRDRQIFLDAANAILVGAALIASVTFQGWLQPPFGNDSDQTHKILQIFWGFNSLSFSFAIAAVMAGAAAALPVADVYIEDAVEGIRKWLVGTTLVLIWSIAFVLGAFAAAGFASLSHFPHLEVNMITTTSIGGVLCLIIWIRLFRRLFKIIQLREILEIFRSLDMGRVLWYLCFGRSREPRAPATEASANSFLEFVLKCVVEAASPVTLKGSIHSRPGHQTCPIKGCYQKLESQSKVLLHPALQATGKDGFPDFLPENTAMWSAMWSALVKPAQPRIDTSFLFPENTTLLGANENLEKYGIVKSDQASDLLRIFRVDNASEDQESHQQPLSQPRGPEVHICHGLPRYAVDLERRAGEVQERLIDCEVLGIIGMGGIGKTTLAKHLFNSISREFEYTCFLEDVKGLPIHSKLQNSLLDKFYRNGKKVDTGRISWHDLERTKALIVMDGVTSESQLEVLPELKFFGDGSRLIITTRDKGILCVFENCSIYEVEFLKDHHAKELFSLHADLKNQAGWGELQRYVGRVVEQCCGLPLTLEVLGCHLRGLADNAIYWEQTIDRFETSTLSTAFNDRVLGMLSIAFYDGLGQTEQEMFLDAAIIFFGKPLDRAFATWNVSYGPVHSRWAILISMSMVRVLRVQGDDALERETIWVHEQLRNLALSLWSHRSRQTFSKDENRDIDASLSADEGNELSLSEPREPVVGSVKLLYSPSDPKVDPEVDVVFFHGLQRSHEQSHSPQDCYNAWLSRDEAVVWPAVWLGQKFPKARISTIDYSSIMPIGEITIDLVNDNLIRDIITFRAKESKDCPVVVVGHSLGGMAIKHFVLQCLRKREELNRNSNLDLRYLSQIERFLKSLKGVFYYSTPHFGVAEALMKVLSDLEIHRARADTGIQSFFMKMLSPESARVDHDFNRARADLGIQTFEIGEGLDSQFMEFRGRVVGEGSAGTNCDNYHIDDTANHFDVCKPQTWVSPSFRLLVDFIHDTALKGARAPRVTDIY